MSVDCAGVRRGDLDAAEPELAAHLADCPPCQELVARGGALARALAVQPDRPATPDFAGLASRLARERGVAARLRALSTRARLGIAALAILMPSFAVLFLAPRPDLALYPERRLLLETSLLLAFALPALFRSLRPLARAQQPPVVPLTLLLLALALPWVLALLPAAATGHPAAGLGAGADLLARAWPCFAFGFILSLPAFAVGRLLDRGGHASRERVALAAAGAGLGGLLALALHCPITASAHLLAGHAGVATGLVLAMLAAVRGGQLAVRARPPA